MLFKLKELKEKPEHFEYRENNPVLKTAFSNIPELSSSGKFPIEIEFDISLLSNTIHLLGKMNYTLFLTCSRCANSFHTFINDPFELSLLISENDQEREEIDVVQLKNGIVDLKPFFHDRVALTMPYQPLCDSKCKGLCPNCGLDLNIDTCKCPQKIVASPFSSLQNFSINRKKGE